MLVSSGIGPSGTKPSMALSGIGARKHVFCAPQASLLLLWEPIPPVPSAEPARTRGTQTLGIMEFTWGLELLSVLTAASRTLLSLINSTRSVHHHLPR